jgi:hypothetical protein
MVEQNEAKQPSMIESASIAAERLEKANAEMKANIAKLEELKAFEKLGGVTQGRPAEQPKAEIDPREYARLAMQGKIPPK